MTKKKKRNMAGCRVRVQRMRWRCLGFLIIVSMNLRATAARQAKPPTSNPPQRTSNGPTNDGSSSSLQSRLLPLSSGRRACGLYLWDAPGALLHAWCTRLMRDCVYEGRGGRKFVRIEPGSVLQLLYPCSRFSPDRCLICGGTFRDHLTLWWSKNLYTPLDRILDDTYRDGVSVVEVGAAPVAVADRNSKSNRSKSDRPRRPQPSSKARQEATRHMSLAPANSIEHAFHRRYVLEVQKESRRGPGGKRVKVLVPRCEVHNDDENVHRDAPRTDSRGLIRPTAGSTSPSRLRHRRREGDDGRHGASAPADSSSPFIRLGDKFVFRMPDVWNGSANSLLLAVRGIAVLALGNLLELEANDDARASRAR